MTARRLILVALVTVSVYGCKKQPAPAAGTPAGTPAPSSAPSSSAPPAAGESTAPPAAALSSTPQIQPVPEKLPNVVARVNGEDISKSDFEGAVRNLETRAGGPVPPSERDRILRGVLDELIGFRLLLQDARTRKVAVTDADVDTRLAEVRKQFPDEATFTKMLAERKLTLPQVRVEMKNEMTVARLLEAEIEPKIAVPDDEITSFYTKNPSQFVVADRIRASHILIATPANSAADVKAAALAKASSLLKEIKGGADFGTLAKANSQDPGSAANGGDLGFFQPGQMVGPFNDVAFKLGKGQVSEVVETEFGYHIIKVTDKQAGRPVPLAEAKPQIERYLQGLNRQKQTQSFVQGLRTKGKVEVFI